jgi:hypothetical protein
MTDEAAQRIGQAAAMRAQITAYARSLPVQERVARLTALAARTRDLCRPYPEPFRRTEWGGYPNHECCFCLFKTLSEPWAWLHYRQFHFGQIADR